MRCTNAPCACDCCAAAFSLARDPNDKGGKIAPGQVRAAAVPGANLPPGEARWVCSMPAGAACVCRCLGLRVRVMHHPKSGALGDAHAVLPAACLLLGRLQAPHRRRASPPPRTPSGGRRQRRKRGRARRGRWRACRYERAAATWRSPWEGRVRVCMARCGVQAQEAERRLGRGSL